MTYNPFSKDIKEIKESDLQILIENSIEEGWYIEYKSKEPFSNGTLDKLKISKSIVSFANTKGGWIFWGVKCEKNSPSEICGFDISKYRNFEDQVSQLISSNISPEPIFHFRQINLSNGKIVFIIQVEESPTPPYINSQGIIFQRENNESKPIKERYIIEKLNEKTLNYYNSIERFSEFELGITKGQSDNHQSFLELYIFPQPFNSFRFDKFYESDFFKKVSNHFFNPTSLTFDINNEENIYNLNLGFNSIYSSERSLIIKSLNENNLIYKSNTVELFENGNMKFTFPITNFDINSIPSIYNDSEVLKFIGEKFNQNKQDFENHIKFIDGTELTLYIFIIVSKYINILRDSDFNESSQIGFRAKISNVWRHLVFFDSKDYLEKIKLYNIPLCPKNDIEIPIFENGKSYNIELDDESIAHTIASFIIEGIGLPDAASIDYNEIYLKLKERFSSDYQDDGFDYE